MTRRLSTKIGRWAVRVLATIAAAWGYYENKLAAQATFGAWLAMELWFTHEEISSASEKIALNSQTMNQIQNDMQTISGGIPEKIREGLQYEYLSESELIWARALALLAHVHENDEVVSTATFPNKDSFEEDIFKRILGKQLVYKRLVCFVDPGKSQPNDIKFPPTNTIAGNDLSELMKAYSNWYRDFLKVLATARDRGTTSRDENLAMSVWYEALQKIESRADRRFQVLRHGSDIPSDYFILNSRAGKYQAVIGFTRVEGRHMQSGFWTMNAPLANDLRLNWVRLWEDAQTAARRSI